MRRGVKLTMSAATVVAVGVGLRASAEPQTTVGVAQSPVGVAQSPVERPGPVARSTPPVPGGTSPANPRRPRSTPSTPVSLTVAGDDVGTAYGPVQVQVTLRAGRITTARALIQPSGNGRTEQINSVAIPLLNQETITAQSAQIDTVSGASFTSDGYRRSLQSALDAAHRAGTR